MSPHNSLALENANELTRLVFSSRISVRVIGGSARWLQFSRSQSRQLTPIGVPSAFSRSMSGKRYVSMPSQVADDLWHEFILYTREYDAFCRRAFGGFLHHAPAVVLSEHRKSNEGLRRVWWYCCKYENIDPVNPTRLPLLFALDSKFNIANGFVYHPDCEELRKDGSGAAYCGGDFADSSVDGSTSGFGDAGSDGSGHGGDGGGDGGSGGDGGGGGCGGGD